MSSRPPRLKTNRLRLQSLCSKSTLLDFFILPFKKFFYTGGILTFSPCLNKLSSTKKLLPVSVNLLPFSKKTKRKKFLNTLLSQLTDQLWQLPSKKIQVFSIKQVSIESIVLTLEKKVIKRHLLCIFERFIHTAKYLSIFSDPNLVSMSSFQSFRIKSLSLLERNFRFLMQVNWVKIISAQRIISKCVFQKQYR